MNYPPLRMILAIALCAFSETSVFSACYLLEWKFCNVFPSNECDDYACVQQQGVPFAVCNQPYATYNGGGSYRDSRLTTNQWEFSSGKTAVETDWLHYTYCTWAQPCNNGDPCEYGDCEDDGFAGSYGSPTYWKQFSPSAQPCPVP